MTIYTREALEGALKIVDSAINGCVRAQPKFAVGTSQDTLLKNRLNALYISKALITQENGAEKYTQEELADALRPIASIISKCEKAQLKFAEGTPYYTRFDNMIKAMTLSKSLIENEISTRG